MPRLSACKVCDVKISLEDEKVKIKNKSYHKECYVKLQYEREQYKLLIKKICEIFDIEVPNGLILKQIKQYKEEFQYSYSGMLYTLWFMSDIEGKRFTEIKYGIALIKYYYEKAKSYFEQQQRILDSMSSNENLEIKIREVKVNLNKVYSNKNKYLLNINDLLGGE